MIPLKPGRHRVWATVTLLTATALLVPGRALAAPDPEQGLDQVEQRLDEARQGLEDTEGAAAATLAELDEINARQAELETELRALGDELDGAESALAEAEARLARTIERVVATERHLQRTQEALEASRARFAGRARASFKHGGTGYAAIMLDVRDMAELGQAIKYARAVLADDRDQIERIAGLERQVAASLVELQDLRAQQAEEQRVAERERDRVATLLAERQALADRVAAEAERRQAVLARIEADRDAYVALVDSLEAESARLEEELRRIAEEQARQEAAAREAEARRLAEAEEQRRREVASRSQQQAASSSGSSGSSSSSGSSRVVAVAPAPPPPPPASSASRFQMPASGRLSSGFGYRTHPISGVRRLHAGIDIAAPTGTPIVAADGGRVYSAGYSSSYGYLTIVDHGGGLTTAYAHQSRLGVGSGQSVSRGQVIGYVGTTGYSTGPHLHFEVRVNGAPVDPMGYL